MTDHSPDHAERAAEVAHALLHSEGEQIVRDMATHVGDEVHGVLKRHGMMMRTTAGTIAMGVLASLQMLAETVEFARKSMDGHAADEEAIASAALCLFVDEATQSLPALAAALRGRDAVDGERLFRAFMAADTNTLTVTALPSDWPGMKPSVQEAWNDIAAALNTGDRP